MYIYYTGPWINANRSSLNEKRMTHLESAIKEQLQEAAALPLPAFAADDVV